VERGWPQMTIWRMRSAYWIPKSINTHPEYVVLIAFPLQQWLRAHASVLRHTYIAFFLKMVYSLSKYDVKYHPQKCSNYYLIQDVVVRCDNFGNGKYLILPCGNCIILKYHKTIRSTYML